MSEEVTIFFTDFTLFFYISKTYFDKCCNFRCLFMKSKHTIMVVYTH